MPPSSLVRSGSIPVEISSSSETEESSDEYWATSPDRKYRKAESASTPRRNDEHRKFKPAVPILNSTSSASSNSGNPRSQFSRGATPQPPIFPNAGASTPQKASKTPAGTPSSRKLAIEAAFSKLALNTAPQFPNPSRLHTGDQKQKVIVIESDSEDDLAPTDDEPLSSPTRPSFRKRPVVTTDSSQSSTNTLFSPISASSSHSSVGGTSTIGPQPVPIANVLTAAPPNVTTQGTRPSEHGITLSAPSPQEKLEAVINFARQPLCADLKPYVISHDDSTQKIMDENMIAWATQFELARGVSNGSWSWTDVRANVLKLQGRTEDSAFKVQQVMKGQALPSQTSSDMTIWKEFDREQAAIMENEGRGLGLMGEWKGVKNWYGGQIQQLARLKKDTYGKLKVTLEPLEKRRSHRYGRFYGSRRFIQLRVPEELLQKDGDQVIEFLAKKFILCGRCFYPFCSKESSIYLVETNENYGRASGEWSGDQLRMTFQGFINWHNPIEDNHRQTKSKYATRFALGLSNSVPALQFKAENIVLIDDITAEDWPKDQKSPPANKLMTDGCGLINHAALRAIVEHMSYDSLPAGVQGRIAGGKGFWILHPKDTSTEPKIWIRHSQNKIQYRSFDRAHCIFDLLAPSRPSPPIALTQQSIMNLFYNGIPAETLVRRMEKGLEEEVAPLMDWDRPNGMLFLGNAINKAGSVSSTRTQRVSVALNRALGLKGRDWGRDETDENGSQDSQSDEKPSTAYTGRNVYSGAPHALHEIALELVQSNFHPAQNKMLNGKIGYIIQTVIKSSVEKYRIPILESLGAFIVPDPLGILEPGEVSYRFSEPRKDPMTKMLVHALTGKLVVGRYPMRLPSDMQKVTAVDKRELEKWLDVLIISTKGFESLASLLAGGDTDGDEIIGIFDPDIVEPFKNQPLTNEPLDFLENNFKPNAKVESLENFCFGAKNRSPRDTSEGFIRTLIGNLSDSQVGLYSMMHERAVVSHGYDHPESIRLAYIFSTLLDASKTGHRLQPGIKERDLKVYGRSQGQDASFTGNRTDILRILKDAATKKGDELFREYQSRVADDGRFERKDKDLLTPYDKACDSALKIFEQAKFNGFLEELTRIRKHVDEAYELFKTACASNAKKTQESPMKKGRKFGKTKQDDPMLACARAYARPIENIEFTSNVELVKASYAYTVGKSESFAFCVAFQDICHIKVMASGGYAPTLRIFDEAKTFSGSFLRALKSCDEEK